ncbi:hypothetical protein ACQP2X_16750 [Actinoplanes sp. CA-131856]
MLKALTADPQLADDLLVMVEQANPAGDRYQVSVIGGSGFQIGSHNTQTNLLSPPSAT